MPNFNVTITPQRTVNVRVAINQGAPGPNRITEQTATPINGVLVGDGGIVRPAEAGEVVSEADMQSALSPIESAIEDLENGKANVVHTHSNATTSAAGFMSSADKAKLNGIATGATANSTDATLLARANHTGVQAISTITGLQTTLDGKAATNHTHAVATTAADGFMSAADKLKFDAIADLFPIFTQHPQSIEVYEGQDATFSVAVTSGSTLQVEKSTDGTTWSDVSGATTSSYTKTSTVRSTDNGVKYRWKAVKNGVTVYSDVATLSVWNPTAITGVAYWLDPSAGLYRERISPTTTCVLGDPVGTWVPRVGSNFSALSDAGRPTLTNGINSTASISGDGVDDTLRSVPGSAFNGKGYIYHCFAAAPTNATTETRYLYAVDTSGNVGFYFSFGSDATAYKVGAVIRLAAGTYTVPSATSAFTANEPSVWCAEALFGLGQAYVRKNNNRIGTSNFTAGAAPAVDTANLRIFIPGSGVVPSPIGTAVIYARDSAIDEVDMAKLNGFVKYKSGIA